MSGDVVEFRSEANLADRSKVACVIRANRASLSIYSDLRSVAEISTMLELEPSMWGEKGDLTRAGRAGRNLAPERLCYQRTFWSLTETDDDTAVEDQTGASALRTLVARLVPRAHALAELRRGGETVLRWSGDSDSTQGGFVLEADLVGQLAELGCDLFGTAYLDEDENPVT